MKKTNERIIAFKVTPDQFELIQKLKKSANCIDIKELMLTGCNALYALLDAEKSFADIVEEEENASVEAANQ